MYNEIKNGVQAVSNLNDIARYVEKQYGNGELAKQVRSAADYLSELEKAARKYGHLAPCGMSTK